MKAVFCIPTIERPYDVTLEALEQSVPLVIDAGWKEGAAWEVGCAYISWARASLMQKALHAGADAIVYIDHDLSWQPQDLLTLLETPGDVVAGTYRFKSETEEYMGKPYPSEDWRDVTRADGAIRMACVPAGFLKITRAAVDDIRARYPELIFDDKEHGKQFTDLFQHGAFKGLWFGEDYAFCRRWNDLGGEIWCVPTLRLTHHGKDKAGNIKAYPGNYHEFLLREPGGSKHQEAA